MSKATFGREKVFSLQRLTLIPPSLAVGRVTPLPGVHLAASDVFDPQRQVLEHFAAFHDEDHAANGSDSPEEDCHQSR